MAYAHSGDHNGDYGDNGDAMLLDDAPYEPAAMPVAPHYQPQPHYHHNQQQQQQQQQQQRQDHYYEGFSLGLTTYGVAAALPRPLTALVTHPPPLAL